MSLDHSSAGDILPPYGERKCAHGHLGAGAGVITSGSFGEGATATFELLSLAFAFALDFGDVAFFFFGGIVELPAGQVPGIRKPFFEQGTDDLVPGSVFR